MLGLITAGLSYPLWIVLRGFGLPAAVRHLIFWPLLAGATISLGITTLREMWTGGKSVFSIFWMRLGGITLLLFVNLIILSVRLRSRLQNKSALPPANRPQPTDT